jgi:hypothetical protein
MTVGASQFRSRRALAFCAVALFSFCSIIALPVCRAGAEGGHPASRPAETEAQLKTWFAELADPNAKVRAEARLNLMGIRASRLPQLRRVVADSRPLSAEQVAALHPIVTQVFLASEQYEARPDVGFLGIFLPSLEMSNSDEGALVTERMPGFVGMRMLRDGDVILGVRLPNHPGSRIHSGADLSTALKESLPGWPVQFQILRQGQVVDLTLVLDPKPMEAEIGADAMHEFNRQRLLRADQYWKKNFAELLLESVS